MSAPTTNGTGDSATDRAADAAGAAKESGQQLAGSAADHARDVAGTASEKASDVLGEAKSQASDLLDNAREQIGSEAENRRGQAVSSLRTIGDELDSMQSHDGEHGLATELAGRGSQYVRQTAEWLDGRQPAEILDDVRRFARERPGSFLLGALVAGVVVGRLTRAVKAGAPAPERATTAPATPAHRATAPVVPAAPVVAPAPTFDAPERFPARTANDAPFGDPADTVVPASEFDLPLPTRPGAAR